MKTKSILLLAFAALLLGLAPTLSFGEDAPPKVEKPNAEHRKEGEQLLGSARDQCRVQYSKTGTAPKKVTDAGVKIEVFKGKHFSVADKVYVVGDKGEKAALTAEPVKASDGYAIMIFKWASGDSETKWYDTFEALKKAHEDAKFGDEKKADDAKDSDEPDPGKQWDELHKPGANWVLKMDFGMAMWQKTEVVKVKDGVATVKTCMKFKEKDEWPEAQESTVDRPKKEDAGKTIPGYKELGKGTEKIKEWDTNWVEYEYNGDKGKVWTSTKYGTLVKMTNNEGKVTMELVELNAK